MESEWRPTTARDAEGLLRDQRRMRERAEQSAAPRPYLLLMVGSAIVMAIYLAVLLFTFPPLPGTRAGGVHTILYLLLILPMLLFSALFAGARERFHARVSRSPLYWAAMSVLFVALVLFVFTLDTVDYPWWLKALVPVGFLVVAAVGPLRRLSRAPRGDGERWFATALSRPARLLTLLVGVLLGAAVASVVLPWPRTVASVVILVLLIVAVALHRTAWGLPRAGFEWGPIQWSAFAIAVGVPFTVAAWQARVGGIDGAIAVGLGVAVAVVMAVGAFLSLGRRA